MCSHPVHMHHLHFLSFLHYSNASPLFSLWLDRGGWPSLDTRTSTICLLLRVPGKEHSPAQPLPSIRDFPLAPHSVRIPYSGMTLSWSAGQTALLAARPNYKSDCIPWISLTHSSFPVSSSSAFSPLCAVQRVV